jgi:anti-sigma factor RsiW
MRSSLTCPDEADLLAAADGEPIPDELHAHLAGCPACAGRLEQIKAEIARLREVTFQAVPAAATASLAFSTLAQPDGKTY